MLETLPRTINEIVTYRAKKTPDQAGFWFKDSENWRCLRWGEYFKLIASLAKGLCALGIKKAERAFIMSRTRYEWDVAEKALLFAGTTVGGIDTNLSSQEIAYILNHSKPSLLVVENEELLKKIPQECLSKLKKIILIETACVDRLDKVILWQDIIHGRHNTIENNLNISMATADEPAFIIYTSGSSGTPKEIVFRHSQLVNACTTIVKTLSPLSEKDVTIAWFSLAYIFGRILNLCAIYCGAQVYFVHDTSTLSKDIKNINPTIFIGVPRFYEKVYTAIEEKINKRPLFARYLIKKSLRLNETNRHPLLAKTLDYLVLRKIRANFGMRLRYMITGSAPISLQILKFFHSMGICLLDGYAVSECATPIAMNRPNKSKLGTVGLPLDGNEIAFAEDGEILIKSPGMFEGYYNEGSYNREEIFDQRDFLKTGDIGYLDEDAFLILKGRKKEIIKTSTGLRISPLEIEQIYGTIPYIEHIIVIGNGRKYLTALITLNKKVLAEWCRKNKISFTDKESLINLTEVIKLIEDNITKKHTELSDFKQIKKFVVLPNNFSYENGELTSNFKLRRDIIKNKYKSEIDGLYKEI